MKRLQKVQFKRVGTNRDGDAVFDLWIDGEPGERGLTIDQVVRRIGEAEETDRSPAAFRTPEHLRESWQRRECPKAF